MAKSANGSALRITARRAGHSVRAPHMYSLFIGLLVIGLLLRRLAGSGLQSYGADGAQYIEHTARLRILKMWQQVGDAGAWRFLFDADAAFPPILHLLTLPSGILVGHTAEAAAAVSLGWLVLLAVITGWMAQRLARSEAAAAAAAVGIFLVPALHGYAGRYYYDLPVVTLCWLAVALLLAGRDRWPVRCAAFVAVVFSAAVLTKWAALIFGSPLLLAALLVRPRLAPLTADAVAEGLLINWRSRALVAALVVVAVAALLASYLQMSGAENSLMSMTRTAFVSGQVPRGAPADAAELGAVLSDAVRAGAERWGSLSLEQRIFYPLRLVTSALSPLLALIAVPLLLLWLGRSRLGLSLLALPLLVYGGFLLLVMPILDDRFLLPLLPALVLGCALGWVELSGPWSRRVGALVIVVGMLVFWDFHFGGEGFFNQERVVSAPYRDDVPSTVVRGLGASSSVEQRGWCRADRQLPAARAFRDELWDQVRELRPTYLGVPGQSELIDPYGDLEWWRYRGLLDQVSGPRRGPEVIAVCPPLGHLSYEPEQPDVVVSLIRAGMEARPPVCLERRHWQQVGRVEEAPAGRAVAFWKRVGGVSAEELRSEASPEELLSESPPSDLLPEDPSED